MTSESATPTPPASSAVVERLTWFADEYAHDESYLTDDNGEQHELREMLRDALSLSQSLARELGEAKAEIERCHARLEIDHHFVFENGAAKRVEVALGDRLDEPDGIECRDATIQILEQNCETLRSKAETAERQLGEVKERLTDERDALEGTQAQLRDANEAVTALERELGEVTQERDIMVKLHQDLRGLIQPNFTYDHDALLWTCGERNHAIARAEAAEAVVATLEAQLGEAREALRPFAEWAANNVACAGEDASFIWEGLGCQRERISVWFGPSEFGRALFSSQALAPLRGGGGEGSSVVYVRGRGPTRPEGEAVPSTREGQRVSARVSIEESAIGEKRWAVIITRPDHIIWRTLWERYATQAEAQKGAEAAHAYLEAGRE